MPTKEFAKRIANEVKLRYLRSTFEERGRDKKKRTHDTAVDFLYGNKQSGSRRHVYKSLQVSVADTVQRNTSASAFF